MNKVECFTETTSICLFWQIVFSYRWLSDWQCSGASLKPAHFSLSGFVVSVKRQHLNHICAHESVSTTTRNIGSLSTLSPMVPSGTSWDGSSFSKFLVPGSAPFLISSFTASTWVLWFCKELTMCRAVFPLKVWNIHRASVRRATAGTWELSLQNNQP